MIPRIPETNRCHSNSFSINNASTNPLGSLNEKMKKVSQTMETLKKSASPSPEKITPLTNARSSSKCKLSFNLNDNKNNNNSANDSNVVNNKCSNASKNKRINDENTYYNKDMQKQQSNNSNKDEGLFSKLIKS